MVYHYDQSHYRQVIWGGGYMSHHMRRRIHVTSYEEEDLVYHYDQSHYRHYTYIYICIYMYTYMYIYVHVYIYIYNLSLWPMSLHTLIFLIFTLWYLNSIYWVVILTFESSIIFDINLNIYGQKDKRKNVKKKFVEEGGHTQKCPV